MVSKRSMKMGRNRNMKQGRNMRRSRSRRGGAGFFGIEEEKTQTGSVNSGLPTTEKLQANGSAEVFNPMHQTETGTQVPDKGPGIMDKLSNAFNNPQEALNEAENKSKELLATADAKTKELEAGIAAQQAELEAKAKAFAAEQQAALTTDASNFLGLGSAENATTVEGTQVQGPGTNGTQVEKGGEVEKSWFSSFWKGGKHGTNHMKGGRGLGLNYYATPVHGIKMADPTYMEYYKGGKRSSKRSSKRSRSRRRSTRRRRSRKCRKTCNKRHRHCRK